MIKSKDLRIGDLVYVNHSPIKAECSMKEFIEKFENYMKESKVWK